MCWQSAALHGLRADAGSFAPKCEKRLFTMAKTYTLHVAGLTRELPICKINDHLDIAAFIMFLSLIHI